MMQEKFLLLTLRAWVKKANNIDHLEKIHKWLRIMRLPNRYPSQSDVKKKLYRSIMNIPEQKFQEAKEKTW